MKWLLSSCSPELALVPLSDAEPASVQSTVNLYTGYIAIAVFNELSSIIRIAGADMQL